MFFPAFFTISSSPSASGVTLAPSTSVLSSASSTRCQLVKLVSVCLGEARVATPFWKMGSTPSYWAQFSSVSDSNHWHWKKKHIQLLDAKMGHPHFRGNPENGDWKMEGKVSQNPGFQMKLKHQKYGMTQETHGGNTMEKLGGFFCIKTRSETFLMGIFQHQKSTCELEYDVYITFNRLLPTLRGMWRRY